MKSNKCVDCGKQVESDSMACPHCGVPSWLKSGVAGRADSLWSGRSPAVRAMYVLRIIAGAIGFYLIAEMTIKEMLNVV